MIYYLLFFLYFYRRGSFLIHWVPLASSFRSKDLYVCFFSSTVVFLRGFYCKKNCLFVRNVTRLVTENVVSSTHCSCRDHLSMQPRNCCNIWIYCVLELNISFIVWFIMFCFIFYLLVNHWVLAAKHFWDCVWWGFHQWHWGSTKKRRAW